MPPKRGPAVGDSAANEAPGDELPFVLGALSDAITEAELALERAEAVISELSCADVGDAEGVTLPRGRAPLS